MKKAFIIGIGIVIILLVSTLFIAFSPLSVLGGGEYHTGFTMDDVNNCETIHKAQGCWDFGGTLGCWYGNIEKDYVELIQSPMNNAPIVTCMKSGEGARSIDVTVYGTLTYVGVPTTYWTPDVGWYKVDINKGDGWHNIISTYDNRVDESIVGQLSGSRTKKPYHTWQLGTVIPGTGSPYISKHLDPITFNIKDPQVGIIRVRQYAEFTALLGTLRETKLCSMDYAFLISGKGTVEKVDQQDRYIAGEDTVRFKCTTGFSGYTMGGSYVSRGWELKIYNNYGDLIKKWDISDDKQNTRYDNNGVLLDYPIPVDAVEPGQSHTWKVVLTNTLFDQDYEVFFAVTREELAQAPGIRPINFSKEEYRLGDTVVINLEGIPNPEGRNKIDGFLVSIIYGTSGTDFVQDYDLKYISSTGSHATITFRASKGDTYVTVEAWAFDQPESEGGIMSEGETAQVWIKDKESEPTVDSMHWLVYVIPIIVFLVFVIIAVFIPEMRIKIILIIIGLIIAIVLFFYLRSNIESIIGPIPLIIPTLGTIFFKKKGVK